MGNYQVKDSKIQAQAQVLNGQVEEKLNYYGIMIIVMFVILAFVLCYGLRRNCIYRARRWLQKEVDTMVPARTAAAQQTAVPNNHMAADYA